MDKKRINLIQFSFIIILTVILILLFYEHINWFIVIFTVLFTLLLLRLFKK